VIWAIVLIGSLLVVAASVKAVASPARAVVGLLGMGIVAFASFLILAITNSTGDSGPMGGISHAQLEADRIMTEQMGSVVGPGMESLMMTNGMLERSANDAYLRTLEQHVYEVDRMLGRVP